MILTPDEAKLIQQAWNHLRDGLSALEQMRPGGGFKEYIDDNYCKSCGAEKPTRAGAG